MKLRRTSATAFVAAPFVGRRMRAHENGFKSRPPAATWIEPKRMPNPGLTAQASSCRAFGAALLRRSRRTWPTCGRNRLLSGRAVGQLLLLAVMLGQAAPAQETLRRITGTVVDQSGAPVPRTLIEVRAASGLKRTSTLTDNQGRFAFDLPDGTFTLDATAAGLAPLLQQPLEVGLAAPPIRLTLAIPSMRLQIVVTATRNEAPLAQVGSSTAVIRGEELESAGIDSMADALRRVAGLTISQNGGNGQLVSLFTRGGESDYTKVMIDGIPVNEPGGSFNFANLSVSGIDRIEIVRGPQSALFGSDAMAGVIQIFTRRGRSEGLEPRPFFTLEGGNLATFAYEAGIEGKGKRLDYAASFARRDTDNNVLNGSFNDTTVSGNFGIDLSKNSQLRAVFRSDAGRAGVPGQWAFYRPDADEYYRHRDMSGGATFTHFTTSSWTQALSYAVNDSRQFSEDSVDSGSFVAEYQGRKSPVTSYDYQYQWLNQNRRQKVDYMFELSLPRTHLLTAGAEYEHESGTVGDPASDPLAAVRNNFAGFAQDQWSLRKRFFVATGVRLEHNQSFGFSATPRVSMAWHAHQPAPGARLGLTKIKANWGLGIKEPTLLESFTKSPYVVGNPNLKAEKANSYDFGIEQHFGDNRETLEVTFFESRYRNQIGLGPAEGTTSVFTYFNIAKTRARGVETTFRQSLGRNWAVTGSYTFLDSLVLENSQPADVVFAPGQPLFRRPRHSGYLDLRWNPGRWTFGATGIVVGSRLDSDFLGLGLSRNPGYGVLDLLVSFRLFSGVTVFAVVNNVLDRDYMEACGYPALPRRFRIGIRTGRE
jgi:vitamin B12 transporter